MCCRLECVDFEFSDFQKATLIWNMPQFTWEQKLDTLTELAVQTQDERLRKQIFERIDYEKKRFFTFQRNTSNQFVYFLENALEEYNEGPFKEYDSALQCALEFNRFLEQGKEEWECYLKKLEEQGRSVSYSDVKVMVYEVGQDGVWFRQQVNPMYLDLIN